MTESYEFNFDPRFSVTGGRVAGKYADDFRLFFLNRFDETVVEFIGQYEEPNYFSVTNWCYPAEIIDKQLWHRSGASFSVAEHVQPFVVLLSEGKWMANYCHSWPQFLYEASMGVDWAICMRRLVQYISPDVAIFLDHQLKRRLVNDVPAENPRDYDLALWPGTSFRYRGFVYVEKAGEPPEEALFRFFRQLEKNKFTFN